MYLYMKKKVFISIMQCISTVDVTYSTYKLSSVIQGQIGWGSEKPCLMEGILACGRGLGNIRSLKSLQLKPFYGFKSTPFEKKELTPWLYS